MRPVSKTTISNDGHLFAQPSIWSETNVSPGCVSGLRAAGSSAANAKGRHVMRTNANVAPVNFE